MIPWPEHYPKQCPPDHAEPVNGDVYRFITNNTPKHNDFRSFYENKVDHDWGLMACQARGLSVFRTADACFAAAAIVPALKKKKIAKAELNAHCGVIAPTPSKNTKDHHTLWSHFASEDLASFFSLLNNFGVANA